MISAFLENVQADNSAIPTLYLLTISHADLPEPIRWVADKVGITSRSATYVAFPFDFAAPDESEDGTGAARFLIDNVDPRLMQTIRAIATPPTLLIESVMRSDPDKVVEDYPVFTLSTVEGDRNQLQASLLDYDDDNEPVMRWKFTSGFAPALVK